MVTLEDQNLTVEVNKKFLSPQKSFQSHRKSSSSYSTPRFRIESKTKRKRNSSFHYNEKSLNKIVNYNSNLFIFQNPGQINIKGIYLDREEIDIIRSDITKAKSIKKLKNEGQSILRKRTNEDEKKPKSKRTREFFQEIKTEEAPLAKSRTGFNDKTHGKTLWRRLINFIKCLNKFNTYDIKRISSDNQIEKEIFDYEKKNSTVFHTNLNESNLKKHETLESKEMFKISLMERCLEVILEGDELIESRLENLFNMNPDRYIVNHKDKNFLFNQPLSDGRNLFYFACREGKIKVVDFFLTKNMDVHIPSLVDNFWESPLEVAARWNYSKIVELILKKGGDFSLEEIDKVLKINSLSKSIKKILKIYKKKNSKSTSWCSCLF